MSRGSIVWIPPRRAKSSVELLIAAAGAPHGAGRLVLCKNLREALARADAAHRQSAFGIRTIIKTAGLTILVPNNRLSPRT